MPLEAVERVLVRGELRAQALARGARALELLVAVEQLVGRALALARALPRALLEQLHRLLALLERALHLGDHVVAALDLLLGRARVLAPQRGRAAQLGVRGAQPLDVLLALGLALEQPLVLRAQAVHRLGRRVDLLEQSALHRRARLELAARVREPPPQRVGVVAAVAAAAVGVRRAARRRVRARALARRVAREPRLRALQLLLELRAQRRLLVEPRLRKQKRRGVAEREVSASSPTCERASLVESARARARARVCARRRGRELVGAARARV